MQLPALPWPHFPERADHSPAIHLKETAGADSFDNKLVCSTENQLLEALHKAKQTERITIRSFD